MRNLPFVSCYRFGPRLAPGYRKRKTQWRSLHTQPQKKKQSAQAEKERLVSGSFVLRCTNSAPFWSLVKYEAVPELRMRCVRSGGVHASHPMRILPVGLETAYHEERVRSRPTCAARIRRDTSVDGLASFSGPAPRAQARPFASYGVTCPTLR